MYEFIPFFLRDIFMKHRSLIHPGYPQCGSTTLQTTLFAEHPGMNLLNGNPEAVTGPNSEWSGNFYRALNQNMEANELDQIYGNVIKLQKRSDRVNVFSAESLLMGSRNWREILIDLRRLFPGATVLIVLRPQIDILRSWYDMEPYATLDPNRILVRFSDWLARALTPGPPEFNHDFGSTARFVEVIGAYRDAFGAENVFVYSTARFFKDAKARAAILNHLGLEADAAKTLLQQRRANSHSDYRFRKIARRILGPFRASSLLSRDQILWIGRQINRVTTDRPSVPSEADRTLVARHFEGQDIATLQAHDWPGVFV